MKYCRITDKKGRVLALIIIANAADHKLAILLSSQDIVEKYRKSYQINIEDDIIIEELLRKIDISVSEVEINCNN